MSSAEVLASVDIVAMRKVAGAPALEVLLHRRERTPYQGQWALPGVLVNGRSADASLAAAAERALREKAHVVPRHVEQVGTEGNAQRDPRGWSMSTYYLALLDPEVPVEEEGLAFFDLERILSGELALPFDHTLLVRLARERLASKTVYSSLPLYLTPTRFTVLDALQATQACLGAPVNNTSLRKRLERLRTAGWIQATGETLQPRLGRPQQVYRHTPCAGEVFTFERSLLPEGNAS